MHGAILAAVLACAAPADARAQVAELGFRGGWTRSSFQTDRVEERAPVYAPSLGTSLAFPVTPHLAIQPELLLALKGSAFSITFGNGHTSKDSYPIAYVEAPVLARMIVPVGGALEPYLVAGPYVAVKVYCSGNVFVLAVPQATTATAEAGLATTSINYACHLGDIARLDVGAVAAAGAQFPLGRTVNGLVDLRYEMGALDVVKGASGPIRNQTLALSFGLSFPLGRTGGR